MVMDFIRKVQNDIAFLDPFPENRRPIWLIHGLGSESTSWQYQFTVLGQVGWRPIAPDLPGFGNSPFHDRVWRIHNITSMLAKWMVNIDPVPGPVVGISMGGIFAQLLAAKYSDKVSAVVLVNTFAHLRPRRKSETIYLAVRFFRAQLSGPKSQAQMVAQRIFPRDDQAELRQGLIEQINRADQRVYRSAMRQLALIDTRQYLKKLQKPTLVVSGAEDSTVSLEAQTQLFRQIPQAQHCVIPKAGHAVIVDQPEQFNLALLSFLSSLG